MSQTSNHHPRAAAISLGIAVLVLILPAALKGQQPQSPTDDSDAHPPVTSNDLKIVKRARELLDSPAKWDRADNRSCPAGAKKVSLYCALQNATIELTGNREHRGGALQEARYVIDEIAVNRNYEHRLMNYNNDPTTTLADIQEVFNIVEQLISLRLKTETSGKTTGGASPSVTKVDIEIAKRARQLLDSPSKWNRSATQDCPTDAQTFSLYCALAIAATQVKGSYDGGEAPVREARQLISESPKGKNYQARLIDFNNDPTVTFADVQKLLALVEEHLTKRLTYSKK